MIGSDPDEYGKKAPFFSVYCSNGETIALKNGQIERLKELFGQDHSGMNFADNV